MQDLSLHILDITENSLRAGATSVCIRLIENTQAERLILEIEDNGSGIDTEYLMCVKDPFFTTKDGKKYGLGLALLTQAAEVTGGDMDIQSDDETGTRIIARFNSSNIDMKPIGDVESTLEVLKTAYPDVEISFERITRNE